MWGMNVRLAPRWFEGGGHTRGSPALRHFSPVRLCIRLAALVAEVCNVGNYVEVLDQCWVQSIWGLVIAEGESSLAIPSIYSKKARATLMRLVAVPRKPHDMLCMRDME